MTSPTTSKRDALPKPAHVLHTNSSIGNIDLFTGDQMYAFRGPEAPSTFPARILALLRDVASREATETHGLFEDGDGEPLQDDADKALAWIAAAQKDPAPAAYMTTNEEGDPAMLFFDRAEAVGYCADDEEPIPLVAPLRPRPGGGVD